MAKDQPEVAAAELTPIRGSQGGREPESDASREQSEQQLEVEVYVRCEDILAT
eukprot:CAMPEP_0119092920 /NCGR_PEP_ID=MMETSP1178-20130426/161391_1 /TAXON_ID=33656 /ORGANISM="unid sp, Strain CCMP2000" /LENGTH=52 /DNA_ID=CAMNT_0007076537 /DNA_START=42 /DNA_END=197 /DNA_ORIENTATION=-